MVFPFVQPAAGGIIRVCSQPRSAGLVAYGRNSPVLLPVYSPLTDSAGFSLAARHERTVTVSAVIASTAQNARAKTHQ